MCLHTDYSAQHHEPLILGTICGRFDVRSQVECKSFGYSWATVMHEYGPNSALFAGKSAEAQMPTRRSSEISQLLRLSCIQLFTHMLHITDASDNADIQHTVHPSLDDSTCCARCCVLPSTSALARDSCNGPVTFSEWTDFARNLVAMWMASCVTEFPSVASSLTIYDFTAALSTHARALGSLFGTFSALCRPSAQRSENHESTKKLQSRANIFQDDLSLPAQFRVDLLSKLCSSLVSAFQQVCNEVRISCMECVCMCFWCLGSNSWRPMFFVIGTNRPRTQSSAYIVLETRLLELCSRDSIARETADSRGIIAFGSRGFPVSIHFCVRVTHCLLILCPTRGIDLCCHRSVARSSFSSSVFQVFESHLICFWRC